MLVKGNAHTRETFYRHSSHLVLKSNRTLARPITSLSSLTRTYPQIPSGNVAKASNHAYHPSSNPDTTDINNPPSEGSGIGNNTLAPLIYLAMILGSLALIFGLGALVKWYVEKRRAAKEVASGA